MCSDFLSDFVTKQQPYDSIKAPATMTMCLLFYRTLAMIKPDAVAQMGMYSALA